MLSNNKIIIPTSYFGNIFYYKIIYDNKFEIEINDFFEKQTIRNRCEILGPNKVLKLVVPCKKEKTQIKNIKISYSEDWRKIHSKSIEYSYRSSPYFEYYEKKILSIFSKKYTFLTDLNKNIHELISECLKIKKETHYSSKYQEYKANYDFRQTNFFKKKKFHKYNQVFSENKFYSNLCILDLIFNLGPDANKYLTNIKL
ncbi:MAG: hypothetical protein CMP58_03265 [Flavobacteriales bacterium]|nr:hypothetical protein [Flavobacteriales bacterium]